MRSAIAVLTRITIPSASSTGATGAWAFGLVGALIGAAGAIPLLLVGPTEPVIAAILGVSAMAILSGGLHLDGLADSADALLAPDATRAEIARKDPAVGTGGTVALILVIGVQVAALASLADGSDVAASTLGCVAAIAASRAMAVVVPWCWRSRVMPDGFAAWFAGQVRPTDVGAACGVAALISLGAALVSGSVAIPLGVGLGAALGLAIAVAIVWGRGHLDGDGIGAIIECTAASILVVLAVLPLGRS